MVPHNSKSDLPLTTSIVWQIENEYGAFGYDDFPRDTAYLESLKAALQTFGIESLFFTSDSPKGSDDFGSVEGGE